METIFGPKPIGHYDGWWPIYEYDTLTKMKNEGKAISLGEDHSIFHGMFTFSNCLIRIHYARSFLEYSEIVDIYKNLSKEWSKWTNPKIELVCLLRGQSKDYINNQGILQSIPSAYRSSDLEQDFLSLSTNNTLASEWLQWASVIKYVTNQDDCSGELYKFSDPTQPGRKVAPKYWDKSLSSRIMTSPVLMAVGMHYGFPTGCLDVTPDQSIALWFSLNSSNINSQGEIKYYPINKNHGTHGGPSVYVYIQPRNFESPTIDLTSINAIKNKAYRPFLQSAWALPFFKYSSVFMGGMEEIIYRISNPQIRMPSAIIKPIFSRKEMKIAQSLHSMEQLFPLKDPLYQALIDVKVSRLAIYSI